MAADSRLRQRLLEADAALRASLRAERRPGGGRALVEGRTQLLDAIIAEIVTEAAARTKDSGGGRPTVLALGGYGRRELAPRSDLDVLFLVPRGLFGVRGDPRPFVEAVLYGLWDLGLEVGHAVRTIRDCVDVASKDASVLSGLLEARTIPGAGDRVRAEIARTALDRTLERALLRGPALEAYIAAKLAESARRQERYGATLYLLEPELKNGAGGLRDLHVALWVARARHGTRSIPELFERVGLPRREERTLERALDFLLRIRVEAHLEAGRKRDSLGFDLQEVLAARLGYGPALDASPSSAPPADRRHRRVATERFMRAYYFHASHLARISALIVERSAPRPAPRPPAHRLRDGLVTVAGQLSAEAGLFAREPSALMRAFRTAQEDGLELYSYAKDQIRDALGALDAEVRRDPRVVADFLSIIADPRDDGRVLAALHAEGVLRRMIPEFARVTARWQHSLYHLYTVDVHALFTVREVHRLMLGRFIAEVPELTHHVAALPRPQVLCLAALLHDVGKGWHREDHSVRGAAVARAVGARLAAPGLAAWSAEDTRDLAWLVEQHLVMSDLSQRRDLTDRALIAEFARTCGTRERLEMLWALTFADMRSTSSRVWNDWKGRLLGELFAKAAAELDPRSPPEAEHHLRWRARLRAELEAQAREEALPAEEVEACAALIAAAPERYLAAVPLRTMRAQLRPWAEVGASGAAWLGLAAGARPETVELTVACLDRPGVLAAIAGTVAALQLDILEALVASLPRPDRGPGEIAVDVLVLHPLREPLEAWLAPDSPLAAELLATLARRLEPGAEEDPAIEGRLRASSAFVRPRPPVETRVRFVAGASEVENVLDVFCPDHLGALHTIAQALTAVGLSIRLARVSTQADRVADGFYVVDAATGQKIEEPARLRAIEDAVRERVDAGAVRRGQPSLLPV